MSDQQQAPKKKRELLPEGQYIAKPIKGMFFESGKTKNPGVKIALEVIHNDVKHVVVWEKFMRGSDDEKTDNLLEMVSKSLAICGWNDKHQPDGIIPKENFDEAAEARITVVHETYVKEGETTPTTIAKVEWINQVGGAGFKGSEPEAITNMMKSLDLTKRMMMARKDLGIKAPQAEEKKSSTAGLTNFAPKGNTLSAPKDAPPPVAATKKAEPVATPPPLDNSPMPEDDDEPPF